MAARFFLGAVVATPGALDLLSTLRINAHSLLYRHAQGDWGDLEDDDRRLNEEAIVDGSRIFSSYLVGTEGEKLWVITDAADDFGIRHSTCILTPAEY